VICRTYQYSNPRKSCPPSPHYLHVIVSGAVEHCLPEPYIERLRQFQHNSYTGKIELELEVLRDLSYNQAITVQKVEEVVKQVGSEDDEAVVVASSKIVSIQKG